MVVDDDAAAIARRPELPSLAPVPIGSTRFCIFCNRAEGTKEPWCKDNLGDGCTYGFGHEFPPFEIVDAPKVKRVDKKLCLVCGLHPKNPASATNGCEHRYAGDE